MNLVVGEPDFDTPKHSGEAAAATMDRGETRYTLMAGKLGLREAIVAKPARENGLTYAVNAIIVTNGANGAIYSAIYSAFSIALGPSDEVIVPAPYWVSHPDMVLVCDGTPITVPCPEENGFKITPAQLATAITPQTRWLLLNSTSNPTGASYTLDEYQALADLLAHPHVLVIRSRADGVQEAVKRGGIRHPCGRAPGHGRCAALGVLGAGCGGDEHGDCDQLPA